MFQQKQMSIKYNNLKYANENYKVSNKKNKKQLDNTLKKKVVKYNNINFYNFDTVVFLDLLMTSSDTFQKKWISNVIENNIPKIESFYNKQKQNYQLTDNITSNMLDGAFDYSCYQNHFEIAVLLCKIKNLYSNYKIIDIHLFCISKMNFVNQFSVLLETSKIKSLSSIELNRLFICCCYRGDYNAIKYLVKKCPRLNVFADNDGAFRVLCAQGHTPIAKWLYQKFPKINISADNCYAMRQAEKKNYNNIILWLQSLNTKLYTVNKCDTRNIYLCCENLLYVKLGVTYQIEKYQKWIETIYLLWLSSSNSPNKNSFIYQLPLDLTRYLIQFI